MFEDTLTMEAAATVYGEDSVELTVPLAAEACSAERIRGEGYDGVIA